MSLMSEYNLVIRQINDAFEDALREVVRDLLPELEKSAESEVYSYAATSEAMENRRGEIAAPENFDVEYGDMSVTIRSTVVMQGTDYGVTEGDFVQLGQPNYQQPKERDFMWPALKKCADDGKIDAAISSSLQRNGVEAKYTRGGYDISEDLVATRTLEV